MYVFLQMNTGGVRLSNHSVGLCYNRRVKKVLPNDQKWKTDHLEGTTGNAGWVTFYQATGAIMPKKFYDRLREYYQMVGEVLRGEAKASAIFPNASDIGDRRERIYAEFLRNHLPASCNILFGGFLFNIDGDESKQLDLIISSGTSPQYKMAESNSDGKAFSCIEGCLGVVSVKSTLDSKQLFYP